MPGRLRRAGEREDLLEEIRRQVADGTLIVRQATQAERASWPLPSVPMSPPGGRGLVGGDREELYTAVVRVLGRHGAPLSVGKLDRAVRSLRDRPRFSSATLREALAEVADPASGIGHVPGRGFTIRRRA